MFRSFRPWAILIMANVVFLCVLSFYGTSQAAPRAAPKQFANATAQRQEMIALLKELNQNIKTQNTLLQSGKLKVSVTQPKKP